MAQQTQLTALGLSGRVQSFSPKTEYIAPPVAPIGKAHKKKPAPPREAIDFRIRQKEWAEHVAEVERQMWAGKRDVANARKQVVVQSETRQIENEVRREIATTKICPVCSKEVCTGCATEQ